MPRLPGRRRRAATALLAAVVVVLAASACTARAAGPRPADGPELTLAFAGDVHFMGRTAKLLDNPSTAFGPIAQTLASSDLTFVNLETPITRRGTAEPKRYVFRTDERAVTALRAAGVDAITLANNHTLDYGRDGLADTLDAAKAGGLPTFGAGRDAAEAFSPWRTTVRGVRIAVLGFSQVVDLADQWAAKDDRSGVAMTFDEGRALAAVSAARASSDLVVVFAHWGTESDQCPNRAQKYFARKLAEAGADIVVGAHAHVLQPDGWLGQTYVAYGMGDFLWYSSGLTPAAVNTGVLKLTVRGRTVVRHSLVPAVVSDTGQPVQTTGTVADQQLKHYAELRDCSGLESKAGD
jgi:poly-gamma-glutamate capsule biosynthesis protein CapA/YwtB (metallophosphatase superfamily)